MMSLHQVLILIILEYIYIQEKVVEGKSCHCLNPYYTGIHLHTSEKCMIRVVSSRLNPYYTGIHLHEKHNGLLVALG